MKLTTLTILAFATIAFTGCKDKGGDSGDTSGDADADTDADSDSDTDADTVDSCSWSDLGLCYEFTNYSDTSAWCDDMAATYSITTEYAAAGCASGSLGTCDLPAGGDLPVAATAYYYSAGFDKDSAMAACDTAGGTWN